jgi:hypothetical protein
MCDSHRAVGFGRTACVGNLMRSGAYYLAKVSEMERLAALCKAGSERDALLSTVEHLREMAGLAAWREREPRTSRPEPAARPRA